MVGPQPDEASAFEVVVEHRRQRSRWTAPDVRGVLSWQGARVDDARRPSGVTISGGPVAARHREAPAHERESAVFG
jgi:hypothetical protein